jgi:hypothetical protein
LCEGSALVEVAGRRAAGAAAGLRQQLRRPLSLTTVGHEATDVMTVYV